MQPAAEERFHPDALVAGTRYEFRCKARGRVLKEVGWFQHMDIYEGELFIFFTESRIPHDQVKEEDLWDLNVKQIISFKEVPE